MKYYITASVTGRITVKDKEPFDTDALAATWIAESATDIAKKLRDQGFKVTVEISNGAQD